MTATAVQVEVDTGLFVRLYEEAFPAAAAFVSKNGGNFDQAKDIFQDALVLYYEQVVATGKTIHSSEKAYLLGIVKHLWYGLIRKTGHEEALPDGLNVADLKTPTIAEQRLLGFLERAGQRCMDMLKAFYYDHLSLEKIAENFGFGGVRSATVQKYKCLEKVRNEVNERKLSYEDFTE